MKVDRADWVRVEREVRHDGVNAHLNLRRKLVLMFVEVINKFPCVIDVIHRDGLGFLEVDSETCISELGE